MKSVQHTLVGFGVMAVLLAPVTLFAFPQHTVDGDAFGNADSGEAVFTIDLWFGGYAEDMYVPVMGVYDLSYGTRGDAFGYVLERGHEPDEPFVGTSTALLVPVGPLERAEIVDGMYRIPAYSIKAFQFISYVEAAPSAGDNYNLRITNLPFYMGDERLPRHYTNGEMKYLYTPHEALHHTPDPE